MPTYVYACDACGKQFEKFQSFKEDALTTCLICEQSGKLRRVFQPVGVVFKGSGWYINDSRKSDSGASATDSPKVETKSEPKSETPATTTETKTETKAETSAKPSGPSETTSPPPKAAP